MRSPIPIFEEISRESAEILRDKIISDKQSNVIDKPVLAFAKESILIAIDELLRTVLSFSSRSRGWS